MQEPVLNDRLSTFFEVGEQISYWDDAVKRWQPGIVVSTRQNKVWIDTLFGICPFDPKDCELWTVPF